MRFNFAKYPDDYRHSLFFLLLTIAATIAICICIVELDKEVEQLHEEVRLIQQQLGAERNRAQQTQQLQILEQFEREQRSFMVNLKDRQKAVRPVLSRVLNWLPADVMLSGLQSDAHGGLEMSGSSATLASLARLLAAIERDELYRIASVAPFLMQNYAEKYSFSLRVVTRAAAPEEGDAIVP